MKLNAKNFTGKVELAYRVKIEKPKNSEFPQAVLYVSKPDGAMAFFDLVVGFEGQTYKEQVADAYRRAQKRWGIQLIKEEVQENLIAV